MKITLEILKILIYFFLQNLMVWGALSFNNDNTGIHFDLTCPLRCNGIDNIEVNFKNECRPAIYFLMDHRWDQASNKKWIKKLRIKTLWYKLEITGLGKIITHDGNLHRMYPVVREHLIFFLPDLKNSRGSFVQFILTDMVQPKLLFFNVMLSPTFSCFPTDRHSIVTLSSHLPAFLHTFYFRIPSLEYLDTTNSISFHQVALERQLSFILKGDQSFITLNPLQWWIFCPF